MEHCPMCERKTARDEKELKRLLDRCSRIEGQVRGIKKMLEDNAYCVDIIRQVSAAQNALNSLNKELIASHMHSCVYNDVKAGSEDSLNELADLLEKLMK